MRDYLKLCRKEELPVTAGRAKMIIYGVILFVAISHFAHWNYRRIIALDKITFNSGPRKGGRVIKREEIYIPEPERDYILVPKKKTQPLLIPIEMEKIGDKDREWLAATLKGVM
jgi:hypothetical protein|tara:strand:- start:56 stop:397 length:342 start_codon:yes stop_codon:yes gene_type:complete